MNPFWRFDNLEKITGGEWIIEPAPGSEETVAAGLSHDTRTLTPGQVYLAVKGENHDGHRFVASALENDAACAIVSDEAAIGPGPVLLVDDTVAALQELASAYRDELAKSGCKVIAVCGSNGKTTTRHLIHHTLTRCGLRGTQSPKSFNNHLGVPLTLLAASLDDDFVACEIGTNHPGEIASLGDIAWPDAAVITSIGEEHLEFFKTLDGVAKEEAAILPYVRPHGYVTLPADAAQLIAQYYDVQEGVVMLPVPPGKTEHEVPDDFPLLGEHNRMNAALVVALGRWLELSIDAVHDALRCVEPPPGRLRVIQLGQNVTVIDDSYNANPDSMRAALGVLGEAEGRRVAVLGDMLELGSASAAAHRAIADEARRVADEMLLIGERFGGAAWSTQLADEVAEGLEAGDTVLLKGSRGMGLERIIPAIEKRFGLLRLADE
ncbi:MAG: UDP-N-acetylmuramoyl-tripeptide--D-alanyl-D-alanine ligase [Planctomycetota bacterium]